MRHLCVFCGSRAGAAPEYSASARQLGALLAARGIGLVYGGGHIGLMGVVADAVLAGGGAVAGVIPRSMVESELAHAGLTALHVVETMHQRKALMADLADGFAAMPGGYGTADELFEILTWKQLRIHAKPVALLNVRGYFDPLLAWLDRCVAEDFIKPAHRELVMVADDPETMLDAMLRYRPPARSPGKIEPEDR
jgi:uncharacterized protein (TIGR00730 family)